MQYAAEVTHPTPEGTSNGLIQLCGQVSVVFVYIMAALRTANGSFTVSLVLSSVLLAVGALVVSRLKDAAPAPAGASGAAPAGRLAGEAAPGATETSLTPSDPSRPARSALPARRD